MIEMLDYPSPTIAEYMTGWLEFRKRDLAETTHARYCTLARNQILPRIGSTRLSELHAGHLERLYGQLAIDGSVNGYPLRSATIGQVHRFLHVCLEAATTQGLLAHNPVDRVKSPRITIWRRENP
jgi:hypothetical protein